MLYEGKSKIIYAGTAEDTYIVQFKDSVTAFNGEKFEEFAGKGKLCAAISNIIYRYLAENGIETHLVKVVDDASVEVKKAEIIPVEVIVRNAAAGSFAKKYGSAEGAAFENTVVEFSVKSDELGDPMINISQITALGLATADELAELQRLALRINELLRNLFQSININLVDFKLEFGRCGEKIILCDEISPDGCRLWDVETGKKLDKDLFRYDLGDLLDGYNEVLRRLENVR